MANLYGPRRPYYHPQEPAGGTGWRVPLSESSERTTSAASAPSPPGAGAELAARVEALTARVAELEAQLAAEREQVAAQRGKAESYLDLAQRTQADFVNYKRRVERERGEEIEAAQAELLAQLLPVLDDLERALSHVPPDLRDHPWAAGLPLVARQLRLALARAGVQRVGAPGEPFDPRLHEAVGYERGTPYPDGHVAVVVQPGYRLRERLIRPARVVVARGEPSGR
jgi:molecular chaperone GrpE